KGREAFDKAEGALRKLLVETTGQAQFVTAQIIADVISLHRAEKNMILEATDEGMDRYESASDNLANAIEKNVKILAAGVDPKHQDLVETFKREWIDFLKINKEVRVLSRENGNTKAFELATGKGRQIIDQAESMLNEI